MLAINLTGDLLHQCIGLDTAALGIAKRLEYHGLCFVENHRSGPMVTRSCAGSEFIRDPSEKRLPMVLRS